MKIAQQLEQQLGCCSFFDQFFKQERMCSQKMKPETHPGARLLAALALLVSMAACLLPCAAFGDDAGQEDDFPDGLTVYVTEYNAAAEEDPYGVAPAAQVTGTISVGNDYSYNAAWLSAFAPYTSCKTKFFNGQPAYCIEPHKDTPGGHSVSASAYLGNPRVRLALAYGYGGADDATLLRYAGNGDYAWLATQEVIWEIVGGYSDLSDLFIGPGHSYDAGVAEPIKNAHDYIWDCIKQQTVIPSFAVKNRNITYNDIELSWNGALWTATVRDTNRVLPNFGSFRFSLNGVTTSRSGYELTINATAEAAKSMRNGVASLRSEANAIDPDSISTYLLSPASSGYQQCVALNGWPDPVYAYVRAKVTKTTGDLNIVKTSEDGKISGVTFTVTGTGDYRQTVTTDEQGKISLPDLQPGTYTVTETTPEQYVPTAAQVVTLDMGDIKTVTFRNQLKKGVVKVIKTCEDGELPGHTFRLTGTSAAGTAVSQTAVTDAEGVAVFPAVPVGESYTLEEVNTAVRYVIPRTETVAVAYKETTEVPVENVLKKWRVTIQKTDLATGTTPHEGVSFAGAVYGLYQDGTLLREYVTDGEGKITTDYYICGTGYTIRELRPPEGYLLDKTEYPVSAGAEDYEELYNTAPEITSVEQVIPGVVSVAAGEKGEKSLRPQEEQKLLERVELTELLEGKTYEVRGWLVHKDSGEPLLDQEGLRIIASATFTMDETFPGYVELLFTFNASELEGKDLVVFDELYQDGELVAIHDDVENAAQTVAIRKPYYYVPQEEQPPTGDAGIGGYIIASVCSLEGGAAILRRRKDD